MYPYLSNFLEIIITVKGHRCGCQPFGLGWMVHHVDIDLNVSSCAVLTLYKDVFWRSYPQQVGGGHHLPMDQCEKTKIEDMLSSFCTKYCQGCTDGLTNALFIYCLNFRHGMTVSESLCQSFNSSKLQDNKCISSDEGHQLQHGLESTLQHWINKHFIMTLDSVCCVC